VDCESLRAVSTPPSIPRRALRNARPERTRLRPPTLRQQRNTAVC
jgi:hypothetical protein